MYLFRRGPKPQPALNPAETLAPADILAKTLHGLSTLEWLDLPDRERAELRNGVAAAYSERNAA